MLFLHVYSWIFPFLVAIIENDDKGDQITKFILQSAASKRSNLTRGNSAGELSLTTDPQTELCSRTNNASSVVSGSTTNISNIHADWSIDFASDCIYFR